jgi:hypothetical protein
MKPVPWLSLVSENWVLAFLLLALICFFSFSQLRYNQIGRHWDLQQFFRRSWWNTLRIS